MRRQTRRVDDRRFDPPRAGQTAPGRCAASSDRRLPLTHLPRPDRANPTVFHHPPPTIPFPRSRHLSLSLALAISSSSPRRLLLQRTSHPFTTNKVSPFPSAASYPPPLSITNRSRWRSGGNSLLRNANRINDAEREPARARARASRGRGDRTLSNRTARVNEKYCVRDQYEYQRGCSWTIDRRRGPYRRHNNNPLSLTHTPPPLKFACQIVTLGRHAAGLAKYKRLCK